MRGQRLALIVVSTLGMKSAALAQPAEGDIEMPEEPAAPEEGEAVVVKDPKVAKKWMQAAHTLMQKGDQLTKQGKTAEAKTSYENAATAYGKAIEAGDDLSLHLQLALAHEKAGDLAAAMKHARVVIAAQGIKPDVAKKAQAKLDDLSMKVGLVTLTIEPDGTAVLIDGKQVGEAPLVEPLVFTPGTHVVAFSAVGFQPKDLELKIEAGSESERKVVLEPVPIVTKQVQPEEEVEEAPPPAPRPSLMPIYVGGGATLGLAMIATVTGIIAVGKHGAYEDSVSPTERADLRSSGKTLALVTDLCLVGAIGAAAFTTYWYMVKYRPVASALAEREARGPKVDVVPWVQLDAGGLAAVGSF